MDMKLRKELRDFISWQIENDMLKDELTIDYEIAEYYLEETSIKHKKYIDFLMEGNEGYTFRDVVDNLDEEQFEKNSLKMLLKNIINLN